MKLTFATSLPDSQNSNWYNILCTFEYKGGIRTFKATTNKRGQIASIYANYSGQKRYDELYKLVEPYISDRLQDFIEFEDCAEDFKIPNTFTLNN